MFNRSLPRFDLRSSRSLAMLVAGCLATTLVVGCGDPELAKQAAFEKQLNEVAVAYADTLGSRPDLLSAQPTEESIQALRSLADKTKSLSGGTAKQQEAARALSASMSRTVGSLELARAAWIESGHQIVRDMALSAASLAADLDAIAGAAGSLNLADATNEARAARDGSAAAARELQEAANSLKGPASQLAARMSEGNARIAQFNQEAAVLLRKARESSPSAGLAFVEEAADIKTEARAVQTAVSASSIEADAIGTDLALTQGALAAAESLSGAGARALELIDAFGSDVKGQAEKTRALAGELRRNAESLMKGIADERAGALKSAYENASTDLENATSNGGGSSDDARALGNLLTSESLRLLTTRLAGIGAQARMLGPTGGAELDALKAEAEALIATLREKSTAAADMLASEAEDSPLADFKKHVDAVKKSADEMTVEKLLAPPAPVEEKKPAAARAGGSSGRSMSGSGAGIQDLDAFVAKLASLSNDPTAASKAFADAIDDSTPAAKAMKSMVVSFGEAMAPLTEAMTEKFGSANLGGMGGGMGGGAMGGMSVDPSSLSNMTQKSNDGSRAVYSAGAQEIVFVKTSSGWKVDLLEAVRGAGMSDEQIEQMAPMMGAMMGPMVASMKKAATEIAEKVRSGELASAEEVSAALQQAMARGMGGGMGGRRGGGGAGGAGGREEFDD
jgi:hypothetical protein